MPKSPLEQAKPVVNRLIKKLEEAGWQISWINDGGDEEILSQGDTEDKEAIFAVDECHVFFKKEGCKTHYVYLIHCNGDEVISDWSFSSGDPDGFDKLMDEITAEEG
jgi:hypothetical protein